MAGDRLPVSARRYHLIVGGPTLQLKVADWVVARIPELELGWEYDPQGRSRPLFSAIGLLNQATAQLIAGAVYEGYNGWNVNAHIAAIPGRHWFTKAFLGEVFRYPFEQLKVRRLTGKTPANNRTSIEFQQALGFTVEGLCRKALRDERDLVITGMLKEDCRWLEVGRNEVFRLVR